MIRLKHYQITAYLVVSPEAFMAILMIPNPIVEIN